MLSPEHELVHPPRCGEPLSRESRLWLLDDHLHILLAATARGVDSTLQNPRLSFLLFLIFLAIGDYDDPLPFLRRS